MARVGRPRVSKNDKKRRIGCYANDELYEALKKHAHQHDVSVSEFLRLLVRKEFDMWSE